MPLPKAILPHVKRVRSKGRVYYYFDTGQTRPSGATIYRRLPDIADKAGFGGSYAALLAHRTRNAAGGPDALPVSGLIDRYQRSREFALLAESTRKTYNLYALRLDKLIGTAPLDEVTRADVMAMIDKLSATPGAANMTLAVLGAVYAWGRSRELTKADPAKGVEGFAASDYEPWPADLLRQGLTASNERIRLLVSLLYYTGQRIGDVTRMRWSDIRGGAILVEQDKTGKQLEIALHPDLLLVLGARPNADRALLARADGGTFSKAYLGSVLKEWTRARGANVVAHGLRKNAVNALIEAGCSVGEVSAVTGQSLAIVEHYAKRRSNRALAAAAIGRLAVTSSKREQEN